MEDLLFKEADLIGVYLIQCKPKEQVKLLYAQAMMKLNLCLSDEEQRIWAFVENHTWSLAFVDSALAVSKPESVLRRKIYTMLAILEACPDYSELFLSRSFSRLYFFKIVFIGFRSMVRLLIGLLIVRYI